MTLEQLEAYKENQRAAKLLEIEIQRMETEYKQLCEPSYVMARKLDGMPRGNTVSDPTARLGVQLAEGYVPPEAVQLSAAMVAKRTQLQEKHLHVLYVDVWLDGLTGMERWVIRMHLIERYPWRIVAHKSQAEFGDSRCIDTLKRIQRNALLKA